MTREATKEAAKELSAIYLLERLVGENFHILCV